MADEVQRCTWAGSDPLYIAYHDHEWGTPVTDDRQFFEMLILEGAQAGLSWITILRKREAYKAAFYDFDPQRVAAMTATDQQTLLANPGIVRNRLKISAAIDNAKAYLQLQTEFGSFTRYIWDFVGGKPLVNHFTSLSEVPAQTELSVRLNKELVKRGFRFVGPTILYAWMQATGLVNDHTVDCFRHAPLASAAEHFSIPSR